MSQGYQVNNVYVTGNTNSGENQISRQDMLAWFNDCLKLQIRDIVELGKGFHYCQMINLLFPTVNAVPLKTVKFGAKSEHEYTENWKKLQNSFKKLSIDKVIPIEKLIKLKMMDNMEFAQWFKKFFDANAGIDECFGQYDAEAERARVNVVIPTGPPGKQIGGARKPATTTAATRPGGLTRAPGAAGAPRTATGMTAPKKPTGAQNGSTAPAARKPAPSVTQTQQQMQRTRISGDQEPKPAADQQLVNDLKAQLEDANSQIEGTGTVIEGLERERDFYFSKLRDIEIITQEHEDSGQLPDENVLKRIRDILYATEDGFIAPEDEEDGGQEENAYQDEGVAAETAQDDDETY